MSLDGKHILLGVSGGIAAYKTPELVRQLTARGAVVQVVLTRAAAQFVTPTTLQAVSGRPVRTDLWDATAEAAMGHIELSRWADAIVVAPATAHTLARMANGHADDLLTALCLAAVCPIAIAPAMNHQMWKHAATQRNVARLVADGVKIWGPDDGPQACGEFGPGRMQEPAALCDELELLFGPQPLRGCRVLVTAGPTREPIDPVRYISNNSSGKQGFAVAAAARDAGATVTLITGPVALSTPTDITRVDVTTAQQMHDAVLAHVERCDLFVGVAAVADYRPAAAHAQKIKKSSDAGISLDLVQNPDIIASVARHRARPFVVGFAAETEDTLANARAKLVKKGLDMIVLNDVSDHRIGFDSNDNAVTVITRDGEARLDLATKSAVARALIERIAHEMKRRAASQSQSRALPS
ncbi:MAG TPA: bifunctional phosphopantothenoylcysteine decarboxylase/phosphopantothenate--cysteine ligase CoaBC [Pseudomonadales bacterium]|nr:bifunctional phosphopantothenoylcysteine decarboxylase/phosphopantothenate--cysteine ligase CoaBC [Pseudomonadales bacterium]